MGRREEHHILHDRMSWESRETGKLIRRKRGLIAPLEHDLHAELHRDTPIVPLLGYHALYRIARDFQPQGLDYLANMDMLQQAITEAGRNPKAHPVERELGELTCYVLELQKPYIQESLSPSTIIL